MLEILSGGIDKRREKQNIDEHLFPNASNLLGAARSISTFDFYSTLFFSDACCTVLSNSVCAVFVCLFFLF